MSLGYLVDVFNDAFEHEHKFSFRPFILKNGRVNGLFGPISIGSTFSPIRKTTKPTKIVGQTANIEIVANNNHYLHENEISDLLTGQATYHTNLESIITFDRLSRTVHVLNYLALLSVDQLLFLEVDPRHILGIKQDHGVYFQDFIAKAGLETKKVVIVLTVYSQYARYYQELLAGLENYRRKGYQIALKFDQIPRNKNLLSLIGLSQPNFVFISARTLNQYLDEDVEDILNGFIPVAVSAKSKITLQMVDDKKADSLARQYGLDYVEGSYYRSIPYDYSGKAEMPVIIR